LYSQAVRQGSQYMRPSLQMRISITDWQRQQNFSHSHALSGCSHCAHLYRAGPVPVLMKITVAQETHGWNVTEVTAGL
jgi:hypothetical protein